MMEVIKRIIKNTVWLAIADIFNKAVLFILSIYIARVLGPEDFGVYSFALAFGFFFTIIVDLGLNTILIREVAKNKDKSEILLGNILGIKVITSIIACFLLIIIINLLNYDFQSKLVVYSFGFYIILSNLGITLRNIFIAYEKMKYDAFITFVEKVIILILGLLILTTGYKIFALGLVFVFATVVSIFFSIFFLIKNFTKVKLMFEWEIQKELIRISYPLALMALFGVICMKTDTIMLSLIKDNIAVSLYNAPYKIIEGFTFIPILFMNSVFPIMSQLSNKNKSFRKSIRYSMFGLALVSIPLTIICMLFSKKIIYIIYGNNYLVASTTFSVLILSLVFIFLVRPIGYALFAKNKQKIVLYAQIVASFINISLNLYFIPRLSFLGAAITTLITQIFIFIVLSTYAVKKRYIF